MKKQFFIIPILFFLISSMSMLVAQSSATVSANSTAEIVAPLVVIDNSGMAGGTTLNFGRLTVSSVTSGSCIVSPANVRSVGGGVMAVDASTTSTASFAVSGKAGSTYAITLPAANIPITREGGVEFMEVSGFAALPVSAGVEQNTGTLVGGNDTFTVGGTLNVDASQLEGVYNGTFNVTVAYN